MRQKFFPYAVFILSFCLLFSWKGFAKVDLSPYGPVQMPAPSIIEKRVQHHLDSVYQNSLFLKKKEDRFGVQRVRPVMNKTVDFYILLGLVLFLGLVRFVDPKYIAELWAAYFNTGFSGRALRDKLEQSTFSNVLMNVFFVSCFGSYVFYIVRNLSSQEQLKSLTPLLILALVGGVVLVYVVKYFVIRFTGWAFDIQGVTETYLFNVFLVNKILAIGLLPFTIIIAFQDPVWSSAAVVLSFIMVLALFISRYIKSWQVLGSFFQYSKFHFFTYLCASEIMPLAILTKFLLSKWI